jgi:hypothetical protein
MTRLATGEAYAGSTASAACPPVSDCVVGVARNRGTLEPMLDSTQPDRAHAYAEIDEFAVHGFGRDVISDWVAAHNAARAVVGGDGLGRLRRVAAELGAAALRRVRVEASDPAAPTMMPTLDRLPALTGQASAGVTMTWCEAATVDAALPAWLEALDPYVQSFRGGGTGAVADAYAIVRLCAELNAVLAALAVEA